MLFLAVLMGGGEEKKFLIWQEVVSLGTMVYGFCVNCFLCSCKQPYLTCKKYISLLPESNLVFCNFLKSIFYKQTSPRVIPSWNNCHIIK